MHILKAGEYMTLNTAGQIGREGLWCPSDRWRVLGAVEYNNFGNIVKSYTLKDVLAGGIVWKYKNGKQKVFIKDVDHGTTRQWTDSHSVF